MLQNAVGTPSIGLDASLVASSSSPRNPGQMLDGTPFSPQPSVRHTLCQTSAHVILGGKHRQKTPSKALPHVPFPRNPRLLRRTRFSISDGPVSIAVRPSRSVLGHSGLRENDGIDHSVKRSGLRHVSHDFGMTSASSAASARAVCTFRTGSRVNSPGHQPLIQPDNGSTIPDRAGEGGTLESVSRRPDGRRSHNVFCRVKDGRIRASRRRLEQISLKRRRPPCHLRTRSEPKGH